MNLNKIALKDQSNQQYSLSSLGNWAPLAFNLGYQSFMFDIEGKRCVSIVSVPSRELFTAIVAFGAWVADASSFSGDGLLSWEEFLDLDDDQIIYFTSGGRIVKGYFSGFNEEYQARIIRDAKSVDHFIMRNNFDKYQIRFESLKAKGKGLVHENIISDFLNSGFDIELDKNWFRSISPSISLNIVKHNFISTLDGVSISAGEKNIDFLTLLGLTESLDLGSAKILLKSEKDSSNLFRPKLAILSSGSFVKLVREYSQSDLVVILEHQEYDDGIISLARSIRQNGEDSQETYFLTNGADNGVRLISKVMKRTC